MPAASRGRCRNPRRPRSRNRSPARTPRANSRASEDASANQNVFSSESVRKAERDGQVLSAEQVQYDGRDVNRVKIVDDRGRVRVMWDDPSAQGDGTGRQQQGRRRDAKAQDDGGRTRDDDDGDPTL